MIENVLFICMGNICRSPMAAGIFADRAAKAGLKVHADSAGTASWHTGEPPDGRAIVATRLAGTDISQFRAREMDATDFERFDLIVGMDSGNVIQVERWRPEGNETPVQLLGGFNPDGDQMEIPDPYYSGKFEATLALIEASCQGLINHLLKARQ